MSLRSAGVTLSQDVGIGICSDTKEARGGARLRGVARTVVECEKGLPVVLQTRVGGVEARARVARAVGFLV